MTAAAYDLAIVGAGINGAGIARDAAGRGLRVLLVEQGDLGGATSSASSKLIHGGLRYLEFGDLRLVREALHEREVLMRLAPHLVRPLEFFLPAADQIRPGWKVRAGLWLYDLLAGRSRLPRSRSIALSEADRAQALQPRYRRGFTYWDCWGDDARLVAVNVMDAEARGARIATRTRCRRAVPDGTGWRLDLEGRSATSAHARALVNAAGPWAETFLREATPIRSATRLRLVQGSHIVVDGRRFGDRAMILQNADGRIVFVLPFEGETTLIGTTDIPYAGDPAAVRASAAEIEYLCAAVNRYLAVPILPSQVIWSFAGVRALHDDGRTDPSAVTRDYLLELATASNGAPCLTVFGGKLTTYRRLAEQVMDRLGRVLQVEAGPWTSTAPLPGGDIEGGFDGWREALVRRFPGIPADWVAGIAQRHGALAEEILGGSARAEDLGEHFGSGLTAAEVGFLARREHAGEVDAVLWRRTKLGLRLDSKQRQAVAAWLQQALADHPTPAIEPER